jgi:ribose transport system permease protein
VIEGVRLQTGALGKHLGPTRGLRGLLQARSNPGDIRPLAAWLLALAFYLYYVSLQPGTFNVSELGTLAGEGLPIIAVGLGQGIVILTAGIDLSVGGVFAVGSTIAATHFTGTGTSVLWGAIIIAIGAGAGVINGFFVGVLDLPPFIVTLATWSIFDGIALNVLPAAGGTVPGGFAQWINNSALGVPNTIWAVAVMAIVWLWFKRTRSARRIYALGSDREGARFTGVHTGRTLLLAYVLSGVCAAVASLFFTMQAGSGDPLSGDEFILTSVAAVVIGGTSLRGGQGGFIGTIAGAMLLTLVPAVIYALNVSTFWQQIVYGAVLIGAVKLQDQLHAWWEVLYWRLAAGGRVMRQA